MTERPPLPYGWREVREALQGQQFNLYGRLGLKGSQLGELFTPLNPTRHDRKPGSFVIYTDPVRAGGWVEYAEGGLKGDILGLVEYCLRLRGKLDAYWWAVDFLGWDRKGYIDAPHKRAELEERARQVRLEQERAERESAEIKAVKSRALFRLWLKAAPLEGSPAFAYLSQARRIPLDKLARLPTSIRWASAAEWVCPETGEVHEWENVMISAMTREGKVTGLHRTWLKADGSGKADRAKTKTMIGDCHGAAIWLTRGASGLPPSKGHAQPTPLIVGEGIETVLTCAVAKPDYRSVAAGSLSLMGLMDWPACASGVVLLRDNDWKKPALEAFARVEAHWRGLARGRPFKVANAGVHNDFNDWVRA